MSSSGANSANLLMEQVVAELKAQRRDAAVAVTSLRQLFQSSILSLNKNHDVAATLFSSKNSTSSSSTQPHQQSFTLAQRRLLTELFALLLQPDTSIVPPRVRILVAALIREFAVSVRPQCVTEALCSPLSYAQHLFQPPRVAGAGSTAGGASSRGSGGKDPNSAESALDQSVDSTRTPRSEQPIPSSPSSTAAGAAQYFSDSFPNPVDVLAAAARRVKLERSTSEGGGCDEQDHSVGDSNAAATPSSTRSRNPEFARGWNTIPGDTGYYCPPIVSSTTVLSTCLPEFFLKLALVELRDPKARYPPNAGFGFVRLENGTKHSHGSRGGRRTSGHYPGEKEKSPADSLASSNGSSGSSDTDLFGHDMTNDNAALAPSADIGSPRRAADDAARDSSGVVKTAETDSRRNYSKRAHSPNENDSTRFDVLQPLVEQDDQQPYEAVDVLNLYVLRPSGDECADVNMENLLAWFLGFHLLERRMERAPLSRRAQWTRLLLRVAVAVFEKLRKDREETHRKFEDHLEKLPSNWVEQPQTSAPILLASGPAKTGRNKADPGGAISGGPRGTTSERAHRSGASAATASSDASSRSTTPRSSTTARSRHGNTRGRGLYDPHMAAVAATPNNRHSQSIANTPGKTTSIGSTTPPGATPSNKRVTEALGHQSSRSLPEQQSPADPVEQQQLANKLFESMLCEDSPLATVSELVQAREAVSVALRCHSLVALVHHLIRLSAAAEPAFPPMQTVPCGDGEDEEQNLQDAAEALQLVKFCNYAGDAAGVSQKNTAAQSDHDARHNNYSSTGKSAEPGTRLEQNYCGPREPYSTTYLIPNPLQHTCNSLYHIVLFPMEQFFCYLLTSTSVKTSSKGKKKLWKRLFGTNSEHRQVTEVDGQFSSPGDNFTILNLSLEYTDDQVLHVAVFSTLYHYLYHVYFLGVCARLGGATSEVIAKNGATRSASTSKERFSGRRGENHDDVARTFDASSSVNQGTSVSADEPPLFYRTSQRATASAASSSSGSSGPRLRGGQQVPSFQTPRRVLEPFSTEEGDGNDKDSTLFPMHPYFRNVIIAYCHRVLAQSEREACVSSSNNGSGRGVDESAKDAWPKSVAYAWQSQMIEASAVEAVRILDLLCIMDSSLVSAIFPAVKRVYERQCCASTSSSTSSASSTRSAFMGVASASVDHPAGPPGHHADLGAYDASVASGKQRGCHGAALGDPAGVGATARGRGSGILFCTVLQFLLNHGHHVIFDMDPVLSHFFLSQTRKSALLAMNTVLFLIQNRDTLLKHYPSVFQKYYPVLLQLVVLHPRIVSQEILSLLPAMVGPLSLQGLFHQILDLPLTAAFVEDPFLSTCNVSTYFGRASSAAYHPGLLSSSGSGAGSAGPHNSAFAYNLGAGSGGASGGIASHKHGGGAGAKASGLHPGGLGANGAGGAARRNRGPGTRDDFGKDQHHGGRPRSPPGRGGLEHEGGSARSRSPPHKRAARDQAANLYWVAQMQKYCLRSQATDDTFLWHQAATRSDQDIGRTPRDQHEERIAEERDAYVDFLWQRLPITPRVSSICKLVPRFLSLFFEVVLNHTTTETVRALIPLLVHRFSRGLCPVDFFQEKVHSILIENLHKVFFSSASAEDVVDAHVVRAIQTGVNAFQLYVPGAPTQPLLLPPVRPLATSSRIGIRSDSVGLASGIKPIQSARSDRSFASSASRGMHNYSGSSDSTSRAAAYAASFLHLDGHTQAELLHWFPNISPQTVPWPLLTGNPEGPRKADTCHLKLVVHLCHLVGELATDDCSGSDADEPSSPLNSVSEGFFQTGIFEALVHLFLAACMRLELSCFAVVENLAEYQSLDVGGALFFNSTTANNHLHAGADNFNMPHHMSGSADQYHHQHGSSAFGAEHQASVGHYDDGSYTAGAGGGRNASSHHLPSGGYNHQHDHHANREQGDPSLKLRIPSEDEVIRHDPHLAIRHDHFSPPQRVNDAFSPRHHARGQGSGNFYNSQHPSRSRSHVRSAEFQVMEENELLQACFTCSRTLAVLITALLKICLVKTNERSPVVLACFSKLLRVLSCRKRHHLLAAGSDSGSLLSHLESRLLDALELLRNQPTLGHVIFNKRVRNSLAHTAHGHNHVPSNYALHPFCL
ncbi:unnamed protein product [Amoebophrya sp. A120]|nr:unnamed protein product [Amoebophrya sp. A120]|eukprot:GSA120T00002202001.1